MKQSRTPSGGASPRCRRYASRRRRRARFLTTLPPSLRPTAKPTARGPGSRCHRSTNAGASTRAPRRKSRSNAARDRSRSARGSRAGATPTPLSLSAGVALWRAAASAPSGRPSSTCARGTHASWRAVDGSVGTSVSLRPPGARPAHSPLILQMASGPRQAMRPFGSPARGVASVAGPRIRCYGGPLGSTTGPPAQERGVDTPPPAKWAMKPRAAGDDSEVPGVIHRRG